MVKRCSLPVAGWFAALWVVAFITLTGCSPKSEDAQPAVEVAAAAVTNDDSDLLLRVRFAGTAPLMAETNAAYLTNLAALPETAALGQRIVARLATLPGRLLAPGSTNSALATNLVPIFSNLLQQGFALELHGDSNGVQTMLLAAPTSALVPDQLKAAVMGFTNAPNAVASSDGWTVWTVGAPTSPQPLTLSPQPTSPVALAVDLASTLLPNPIRESVYGGFERFSFTAVPTANGFKIRGNATYAADLPALSGPVVVPTNLVTDSAISFSMVRNPAAWLAPDSPIRNLLPQPIPDIAWFWGGESSPYQFFFAIPFVGTNEFNADFGPRLVPQLEAFATSADTGSVVLDTNRVGIQWQGVPFAAPQLLLKPSLSSSYLVAETFPAPDFGPCLTSPLLDRTEGTTNTVLFDWEFTAARVDTWFRVGQLALFMAGQRQLGDDKASTKWLQALMKNLPGGGNMFTEIAHSGPRELSLDRLAPVGFSSIELFWLANWLESDNFPAANFLVPAPSPFATPEPEKVEDAGQQ